MARDAVPRGRLTAWPGAGTLRDFVPPATQEATMTTIAQADLALLSASTAVLR
ncbi:MAG: hypothetical protein KF683_00985 [Rubrivivax sp.]|nr:hypothetical protein [Rubrivivax sp.]